MNIKDTVLLSRKAYSEDFSRERGPGVIIGYADSIFRPKEDVMVKWAKIDNPMPYAPWELEVVEQEAFYSEAKNSPGLPVV